MHHRTLTYSNSETDVLGTLDVLHLLLMTCCNCRDTGSMKDGYLFSVYSRMSSFSAGDVLSSLRNRVRQVGVQRRRGCDELCHRGCVMCTLGHVRYHLAAALRVVSIVPPSFSFLPSDRYMVIFERILFHNCCKPFKRYQVGSRDRGHFPRSTASLIWRSAM